MLLRIALIVSVLLNLLLAGGHYLRPAAAVSMAPVSLQPPAPAPAVAAPATRTPPAPAPAFHWSQVESTNYESYVANLRRIGCPEQTIRDILSADLAALYQDLKTEAARSGQVAVPAEAVLRREQQLLADHLLSRPSPGAGAAAARIETSGPASKGMASFYQQVSAARSMPAPGSVGAGGGLASASSPAGSATSTAPGTQPGRASAAGGEFADNMALPDSDSTAVLEGAPPEPRRRQLSLEEWIRTQLGGQTLLSWEREAVGTGRTLEEVAARYGVQVGAEKP